MATPLQPSVSRSGGNPGTSSKCDLASNNITNLIRAVQSRDLSQIRDQKIPDYQNDLDTLANTIINQVNTQHAIGNRRAGKCGCQFLHSDTCAASAANAAHRGRQKLFCESGWLRSDG